MSPPPGSHPCVPKGDKVPDELVGPWAWEVVRLIGHITPHLCPAGWPWLRAPRRAVVSHVPTLGSDKPSCDCCDKLPYARWFQTAEMDPLTVWRREAPDQYRWARTKGPAAPQSLRRRGGGSSLAPSHVWWQLSFWACGPIIAASASVVARLPSSCLGQVSLCPLSSSSLRDGT